ncbi:MAG: YciI family protein [Parvibaculaceae bacterium]
MAKYLFIFHGATAPANPEDIQKTMDAWGAWYGSMGAAVIDGGNPVGKSYTVKPDGSLASDGGANPASGYSLIEASSLEDAHRKAKGCPILKAGGTIEIAEAIDM